MILNRETVFQNVKTPRNSSYHTLPPPIKEVEKIQSIPSFRSREVKNPEEAKLKDETKIPHEPKKIDEAKKEEMISYVKAGTEKTTKRFEMQIEKITIDTIDKLQSMSFKEIKDNPIYKLRGKIMDEAMKEALRIEAQRSNPDTTTDILYVEFKVHFKTRFGQDVFICGSDHCLGAWDARFNGIQLGWTDGHFWQTQVQITSLSEAFEYKYILRESSSGAVKWESGPNHKVNLKKIRDALQNKKIAYKRTANEEVLFEDEDLKKYRYNKAEKKVVILDTWQN